MKSDLAIAYAIKRRNMAQGGMAHCAHGGPIQCSMGCYSKGGEVGDEMEEDLPMESELEEMPPEELEESTEEPMNPLMKKRSLISRIMRSR